MSIKKYRCLVIDDEPIARKIVKNYIAQITQLHLTGECKNAIEAIEIIKSENQIDIIFLDINMPNLSGITFAKLITGKQQIIFTTAYSEYAIESYDLDAADYLLKPFSFERFSKAVYKAIEKITVRNLPSETTSTFTSENENRLLIKSNGETYSLSIKDIVFCEAMKNYTKIVTRNNKTYTTLITLSKFESELIQRSDHFLRIHRSFIISKMYIFSIGSNYVMLDKHKIPIGEQYKKDFFTDLKIK